MTFNLSTPYCPKSIMTRVVDELDAGYPTKLPGPPLPVTHLLTPEQKLGLMENVRRVITITIQRGNQARSHAQSVKNQLRQPRFRFLDQIPEAKEALRQALLDAGLDCPF